MEFSDFTTEYGNRIPKHHYLNLVEVFKIGGKITDEQMELLYKQGMKFGLTEPEVDNLIKKKSHHPYHAPYSLEEKFGQLYNVVEMVLADDNVSDDEIRLLRKFAVEVGFDDKTIEILRDVLITGIRNHEDQDELYEKFRKEFFKR
jgi:uncharacterized protein YihD (DUF1040 family)